MPSGVVAGDIILIFFAVGDFETVTFPAGWTTTQYRQTTEPPTRPQFDVARRISNGTEGASISVSVTNNSGANSRAYEAFRISGGKSVIVSSGASGGSGPAPNSPNLAPGLGAKDFLWFSVMSEENTNVPRTPPANYSGYVDQYGPSNGVTFNDAGVCVMIASRSLNAASEAPGAWGDGVKHWAAATVAIEPNPTLAPTQAVII
jgi:hypothetical protein